MSYLGDFNVSAVVHSKFTTVQASGAPTTLSSTPAIQVYKDSSTTQTTAGITLTVDFDGVTGLNHLTIETTADSTFYAAGSNFMGIITAGTVNAVSVVGYTVCEFSLQNRSALRPATAGRTIVVSTGGVADANVLQWNSTAIASPDAAGYPKVTIKSGTGTGELNIASGVVDADVQEIDGDSGAATQLQRSASAIVIGTVGVGSSATSIVTSSLSPAATTGDQFKGRIVIFDDATTTAALRGQATDITASSAGGVLTVTALTVAPANTDTFTIT